MSLSIGLPRAAAATKDVVGNDLTQPLSYSPNGLPADGDDLSIIITPAVSQPFRLDGSFWLTASSLTNATSTAVSVINNGVGVSTLNLTGSETVATIPVLLASPNGNLTVTGLSMTASSGVGFLDIVLGRSGRIVCGANRTLTITSAIDNGGNLLRLEGAGKINIGQPLINGQNFLDPTNYGGISGSGGLSVGGSGASLVGTHTYTGTTTIAAGAVLSVGGTINNSAAVVNNGTLLLGDPDLFVGQTSGGLTQTMAPLISGIGGLRKTGNSTRVMAAGNTYSGVNSIEGGVLTVDTLASGGQASGIGASTNAAANLKISNGTLRYTGGAASTDRLFTSALNISPSPTPTPPAGLTTQIESSGTGPLTFSNTGPVAFDTVNVGRGVTLGGTNTGLNVFAPQITNNGSGSVAFVKTGPGTWKLSHTQNSYSGGTYVYGGTLLGASFSSFSNNGSIYVGPNGAVGFDAVINNNQLGTGRLTGTGTVLLGGDSAAPISFALNANTANLSLGVAAGQTNTLSGTISPANNTYRLGGGGGTLVVNSALTGARQLVIGVPLQQTTTGNIVDIPDSSTPAVSRVVLNGANTFTGPITVNSGIVEMGNAAALGTGTIRLAGQGTVVPFGVLDQPFLNRITNASIGSVAITGDNANNLDLTNAFQTMLGASGNASYSGTLTPASNVYRLGGGGGILTFNSPLSNNTANNLIVAGNGLPGSTVVLNNTSNVATVNVTDAKLTLGENGALGAANVTLAGAATLDLGGKSISLPSLNVLRNTQPLTDVVLKNGQLLVNGLGMGTVATPFDTTPTPVARKVSLDMSGLSRLTFSSSNSVNLVASNGLDSTIRLAADNSLTSNSGVTLGAASGDFSTQPRALIELGRTNLIRASTLDLGTIAGSVAQTLIRFPEGVPSGLAVFGPATGFPISNVNVRSGSFSETTLDLSGGTTSVLAENFYAGRHGYTLGTKTNVILGGGGSVVNTGRLYLNYAQPTRDLNTLPTNPLISGASDDRFEQRAGTVLAGALYVNSHAAGAAGQVAGDTMRSTYVLGTPDSQAILSVHRISLGGATQTDFMTAKSRATIDFVNGRLETFDASRSTSPVLPQQPVPVSEPTTVIRGLVGGGAANDYRTLNINLAATGTHTFAAGAGKFLQIESTAVISGPGGLSVEGPGLVSFAGANTYAGLTTLQSGTLDLQPAAQTVILAGGGVDVRNGRLKLLVASGADPAPLQQQVHDLLAASYGQNFAGGQFRSGTATPARGLGYRDNFNGIVITPALYGDADLDGVVNFNDFLALQNGFNTNAGWQGGDFNYSGLTDFNDFLLLQNNFGTDLGSGAVPVTPQERAALAAFAATVPEPGMMAALLLGATTMVTRRRRS